MRRNPVGFFGMVHVLEGTSVALALHAADRIQQALGLPTRAFTYLRSHGELDQEHIKDLAGDPRAPHRRRATARRWSTAPAPCTGSTARCSAGSTRGSERRRVARAAEEVA